MNTKPESLSPLLRIILILALLLICAALRLAPHPWNFTPIGAMAIFAGAMLRKRPWAFLFPIIAMFATDLIIGFNARADAQAKSRTFRFFSLSFSPSRLQGAYPPLLGQVCYGGRHCLGDYFRAHGIHLRRPLEGVYQSG